MGRLPKTRDSHPEHDENPRTLSPTTNEWLSKAPPAFACACANRWWLDWGFKDPMKTELQIQDHTSIYASDQGYCCILQKNGIAEPHLVLISPVYVDDLCAMLQVIKLQALRNRENFLKSQEGE